MHDDLTIPDWLLRKKHPENASTMADVIDFADARLKKIGAVSTPASIAFGEAMAEMKSVPSLYTKTRMVGTEAGLQALAEDPSRTIVRVYLANRIRGCNAGPGWHDVELLKKGWKHVRIRFLRNARANKISRTMWDQITGVKTK
jgi:hypothetical protein